MNSVNTFFNIDNSNIIKTLLALNSFLHYIMTTIAKIWFMLKSNIFKIPIATNIHSFDKLVLLTSIPSQISFLSYSSIFIRYLQLAFFIRLIHTKYHLEKLANKVYHLLQKQI